MVAAMAASWRSTATRTVITICYVMNADGSGMRAVTHNNADDLGPDWSPDGSHIAYHTSVWGTPYELAVLNLSTGEIQRLTDNADTNAFPTWSPDGSHIAYHAISALNDASTSLRST